MLRLHNSLMFPSLVRKGEANFKCHTDSSKTTTIYMLDWSHMDETKANNWVKWRKGWKDDRTPEEFHGTLPAPYDDWVKDLQFTIPADYLDQIHRNTRDAVVGWATEYHFDTMIREICLKPAIANAFVAFMLLADCIYDPKTNYFTRHEDKFIAPHVMLYKFWICQTGRGLIRDHAGFKKITWFVEKPPDPPYAAILEKDAVVVRKFIAAIDAFEEDYEKQYELMTKDDVRGCPVGPSKEPSIETL